MMQGLTPELKEKARRIRRHIIEMTAEAGSGHPGGSLSAVEILVALYFNEMRYDTKNPAWPERDRFILSKGHGCSALYATLAEAEVEGVNDVWDKLWLFCALRDPGRSRILPG